jgi:16S rRNA (guanine1207-N2)-methyltransferase
MTDHAFGLLQQPLNDTVDQTALWLVDENISATALLSVQPRELLTVISNRFDLVQALQAKGFNASLSDYDFSGFSPASIDVIYYRVSKEKAIVHHCINAAGQLLKPAGRLMLAGYKNEGIKSYVDKAARYLGGSAEKKRSSNSSLLAVINKAELAAERLDDKNYQQTITLEQQACQFVSKPGVYGWNKIDKGSELLIEQFAALLGSPGVPAKLVDQSARRVADLGCGYGFLSVKASRFFTAEYFATDNNVAAVALCEQNFQLHNVSGAAFVDDCGASIDRPVDVVLCNPPFHQGFDVAGDLTLKFLQASSRILKRGGIALFVVNSFIALEKKSAGLFTEVRMLENTGSFKVLLLTK